jgi:hypothetical protein
VTVRSLTTAAGALALATVLMAGAVQVQAMRERVYPPAGATEADLYMRSGVALRRLTGAYSALGADVYWIRAIQHFGGTKRRLAKVRGPEPPPMLALDEYTLLYPLLDITTSLDPRFNIAYRFGAVFLAEPYPGGAGRPDLAIALLEKGLRERPGQWEYMEDIGFVYYWYVRDYGAAARWFTRASEVPGAPWWLASLAATTLAAGGDRQSSRVMWEAIRQLAENDWLRQDAERRLAQLRALDEIDQLQRVADAFVQRIGRPPSGWGDLVRARALPGVPLDPARTPYELSTDGRVRLSASSKLWPLPEEPARLGGPVS